MKNYIWPPQPQERFENYLDTGVPIYKQMYGSLSDEVTSPFRRISVANIGFSLDPVKGCPLKCSYCVRLSNKIDGLFDDAVPMSKQRVFNIKPEVVVAGDVLIKNLVKHPAFIKNLSVITIATGSSEAFAPVSVEETKKILHELRSVQKLANPVWIVTKLGIDPRQVPEWRELFKKYTQTGVIVLSVTSSGLPPEIESHQADRFAFVEQLGDCGVYVSHHLRPIIRNINDSYEVLKAQLQRSLPFVKSVCVGGLRLDPGIKIAWQDISKLSPDLLPSKPGEKDLSKTVPARVRRIMDELGYKDMPLYLHSSHVLAAAANIGDFCLQEPADHKITGSLLGVSKNSLNGNLQDLQDLVTSALKTCKIKVAFEIATVGNRYQISINNSNIMSDYRTRKVIIQTIGHLNNSQKLISTNINDYWKSYNKN